MFIKHMSICNLFAYYGKVEVDFNAISATKNIYVIFGDNGYGKTSFIRCAKLLFLGTGLLKEGNLVPETIRRFHSGNIKIPSYFIKGWGDWQGILNTQAKAEGARDFYIRVDGVLEDKKSFCLQRSWTIGVTQEVCENLFVSIGERDYKDEEAQDVINEILPPDFVEFFFFDGEELEIISQNINKQFQNKVMTFLGITPLEQILKQAKNLTFYFKDTLREDQTTQGAYTKKNKDLESEEEYIQTLNHAIEVCYDEYKEFDEYYLHKDREINQFTREQNENTQKLLDEQEKIQKDINEKQSSLKELLADVVFVGNLDLVRQVQKKMEDIENRANKNDLDALKRLLPDIAEVFRKELQNKAWCEEILSFLPQVHQKLSNKHFENSPIPQELFLSIKKYIEKTSRSTLASTLLELSKLQKQLKELKEAISENTNNDKDTQTKVAELEKEKEEFKKQRDDCNAKLSEYRAQKTESEQKIQTLQKEIQLLEQKICTERIQTKLDLIEAITQVITNYKEKLLNHQREALEKLTLEKYKILMPNDNLARIEINQDFTMVFKNKYDEPIYQSNQSKGQNQVLATAILWALSELSSYDIPLIIDTPLGRLDKDVRQRIILEYYKNSQFKQIIVLPTSAEMGKEELVSIEDGLSGLYQINNADDRRHATIVPTTIAEITQNKGQ
ncbi:hypothetical protein BKH46_08985 [Helicobacter sp. 12S02634-8]|uniref:AAA family ATPase n=1 Tax=Helicobacter sp. 12S02634-8 TaxID=1476199 RepID=UPI000BA68162|nr:AAA family ATPase [Helicobacter sp. 12S02634-8]PAF46111.1 hypothetical protein BKH46_08985 [Helicobacter sp. 12S02634-8]